MLEVVIALRCHLSGDRQHVPKDSWQPNMMSV
ncbi:hypothetical protein SAMN06269250_5013 [Spirosoma fluviale]|uniref:Uncharacterized protein n=1 Tax=Spirosoma fluviale TaxID=1597977 RepID=A0A286GK20_9BACT|nr:hypothetical protein SAMN06269250_5013 [Spirosoma fluviale]